MAFVWYILIPSLLSGDNASDLDVSDQGSVSCEDDSDDSASDDETDDQDEVSSPDIDDDGNSSVASIPLVPTTDSEFRMEAKQSLDRAFAEDHSLENAAVELKTLRMASNVPLKRVREAVIAAIVECIKLVPGDPTSQRGEIARVIDRWGELINKIGGVDGVESVEVLQVRFLNDMTSIDAYITRIVPLCIL